MTAFEALILGIVQGLTEFLPVSSSGHLVLVGTLLGVRDASLAFDVLVHVGTLLAVVVALWSDVKGLIVAFCRVLVRLGKGKAELQELFEKDPYVRLLVFLIVATIPIGLVGFLWEEEIAFLFTSVLVVGVNLLITGSLLWYAGKARPDNGKEAELNFGQSILVGLAQVLALAPGVSRSGVTISAGVFAGMSKDMAARFSFLLSLPAIAGATILQIPELVDGVVKFSIAGTGFLAAAVSGYVAIKVLLGIVRSGQLYIFSYYTWALGILVVVLSFQ